MTAVNSPDVCGAIRPRIRAGGPFRAAEMFPGKNNSALLTGNLA
jgi:hypothetical protein